MIINNIPCRWWKTPICSQTTTHLIIMICWEGHLRERLLCENHTKETTINIDNHNYLCPEHNCGQNLARYMTTNPIYDHYNLHSATQDTKPIHTTNDPEGHNNTWINHPNQLYPYPQPTNNWITNTTLRSDMTNNHTCGYQKGTYGTPKVKGPKKK